MGAVAGGAGRGARVLVGEKRHAVDAQLVGVELIGGDAVRLHALGVRVAAGAEFRHVEREDRGRGVSGLLDVVDAVAVRADGHALVVAGQQLLAVDAGEVLGVLVRVQVVRLHPVGVGVAAAAQANGLDAAWLANEPALGIHGNSDLVR